MAATPQRDNGGIALAALILTLGLVTVAWLTADACIDDQHEPGDLGYATATYHQNDKDEHADCGDAEGTCTDDDFSPSFDNSPIIICVQPGACQFGDNETA